MVAITVILAAVIAAFVFGTVGEVKKEKEIAVAASQTRDASSGQYSTTVTYHGGNDFRYLLALEATIRVPGGTPDSGFTWDICIDGNSTSPGRDHRNNTSWISGCRSCYRSCHIY